MFSTHIKSFYVLSDVSRKNLFKQVQAKDLQLRCQTSAKYCHGTTEDVDAKPFSIFTTNRHTSHSIDLCLISMLMIISNK
jgi:hypothetical protein